MFKNDERFLVVDDFRTMRAIIIKNLNALGYQTIDQAEDGLQAHEMVVKALLEKKPYSCIISDWNMPQLKGIDFLKLIRQHDLTKSLPFMLVTAENEQKHVLEAVAAGVSGYIVKPFAPEAFQQKLNLVYLKHHKKAA